MTKLRRTVRVQMIVFFLVSSSFWATDSNIWREKIEPGSVGRGSKISSRQLFSCWPGSAWCQTSRSRERLSPGPGSWAPRRHWRCCRAELWVREARARCRSTRERRRADTSAGPPWCRRRHSTKENSVPAAVQMNKRLFTHAEHSKLVLL